jgi:succinate dehydrogenase / fumarate reductase iron-sulfur subunit
MVEFRIRRQDSPTSPPYYQEFLVPYQEGMNVIAALMEIQRNPVTKQGEKVSPPAWEASCLEEVCGACTMVINGKVRQSCSALVDHLTEPITLEPMSKFPVVRDLIVDRTRMFDYLKRIKGWVPIDGTFPLGPGPRYSAAEQRKAYLLSRCITCGCCVEVCPQVNPSSPFMGPQVLGQVYYFSFHPLSKPHQEERVRAVMGKGGVMDCGNAQLCEANCPKGIPLLEAIAHLHRETTRLFLKDLFSPETVLEEEAGPV